MSDVDLRNLAEDVPVVDGELLMKDYDNLPEEGQKAMKCQQRILDATNQLTKSSYDLALSLNEALENDYEKQWGISFVDFAEQKLKIGYRTAYQLAAVGKFALENSIPRELIEEHGITKFRELVRYVKALPEGADKKQEIEDTLILVEEAKTVLDLKEELNERKSKFTEAKEATEEKFRLTSQVYVGEQARQISDALTQAMADNNLDPEKEQSVKEAIFHITTDWLAFREGGVQSTTLEDWIKFIQKRFGVTLVQSVEGDNIDSIMAPVDQEIDLNNLLTVKN